MLDFSSTVFGVDRREYLPIACRPVHAYEDKFPLGYVYPEHTHDRAQLSFSLSGVMSVLTDNASFILPPGRAIWVPAKTRHQVACRGAMHFQIVYIDPDIGEQPDACRVFDVSPLVRGLIHEMTTFDLNYDMNGREGRIVRFLLEEIERMPVLSVRAIMPRDARLKQVCDAIMAAPSDNSELSYWAGVAGMSRRSFTRHFKQETGMGLAAWRQQVRLMEAAARLSSGESVTHVALAVGYDSPSAFATAFQRAFGAPPSTFRTAGNKTSDH